MHLPYNNSLCVQYACRKTLADRRVRVRGRFARNNELCEEESGGKKNHDDHPLQEKESFCNDALQVLPSVHTNYYQKKLMNLRTLTNAFLKIYGVRIKEIFLLQLIEFS